MLSMLKLALAEVSFDKKQELLGLVPAVGSRGEERAQLSQEGEVAGRRVAAELYSVHTPAVVGNSEIALQLHREELRLQRAREAMQYADAEYAKSLEEEEKSEEEQERRA